MTMKHTPLPWTAGDIGDLPPLGGFREPRAGDFYISNAADFCPGIVWGNGVEGRANAEFIVRACNAHCELLDALRTLIQRVEHYAPQMAREGDLDDARAAIAKAEGRS